MKFNIEPNNIDLEVLKTKLEDKFPDYKLSMRNKAILNVAKTSSIGCIVILQKKKIIINGNFPTMKSNIIFTVCMVMLGILIPIIVYFAVFHKKMKAVEKEIAEYIRQEYNLVA